MRVQHLAFFAIIAVTVAKPPSHSHRRAHAIMRGAKPSNIVYIPAAIETVVKYVLDGHDITEEEVRQGVANGTLIWGSDGNLSTSSAAPIALPTQPPAIPEGPNSAISAAEKKPEPTPQASAAPAAPSKDLSPPAPEVDTTPKLPSDLVDENGKCASCDTEFPNGKIPCSKFPYGYGAVPVSQEGLGGWSGIQDPGYRGGDGFDDIRTVVTGSCNDGSCCTKGTYCSYGCPNPYLKLSFPKAQGRTGQTVGGLYCNNQGYLEMADGSIGKTLCGKDSDQMKVKVVSRLSKPVSFCRTDYPGHESMTFPLTLKPGQTGFLANPDQKKYFFWNGKPTSAHYYVNDQGVSEAEGCTWSTPSQNRGNWAPTIIGTSFDDINTNQGFTSLKQNELNKNSPLNYSITFKGDGIISPCKYDRKTDQYCQGTECWSDRDRGCTAAVKKGSTLIIVLHDDNDDGY